MTLPELKMEPISWHKPMIYPIPHKTIEGLRLGYTSWGPQLYVPPIHLEHGFDALHLFGGTPEGELTDVVMPPNAGGGDSTMVVDAAMRVVIFENFRFHGTGHNIIRLGATSAHSPEPKPLWVEFRNCEFTTDDGKVKQGITGHQAGVRFYNCRIGEDGFRSIEHFAYLRGQVFGPDGLTIHVQDCHLDPDECAEIIKSPTRIHKAMGNDGKHGVMDGMWPLRGPNNERPTVLVENSVLHRKDRASMEGGGVVFQDGDKHLIVRNSIIAIDNGPMPVALDAISEGIGPDGVTLGEELDGHPGNGNVLIEDSALISRPAPGRGRNVLRFMSCSQVVVVNSQVWCVSTHGMREDYRNPGQLVEVPSFGKIIIEKDPHGQVFAEGQLVGVNTMGPVHGSLIRWLQRNNFTRDTDDELVQLNTQATLVECDVLGPWQRLEN